MGALNATGYEASSGRYLMLLNDDVVARTSGWDDRMLECFRAFPDAVPALQRLRAAGLRTVVVSNWDVSLHDRLAEVGLAELVDGAVTSAEVGADSAVLYRLEERSHKTTVSR